MIAAVRLESLGQDMQWPPSVNRFLGGKWFQKADHRIRKYIQIIIFVTSRAVTHNGKELVGGIDWGRDTPKRLYKAPTDYTKPQNIIQRPQILNKTRKYYTNRNHSSTQRTWKWSPTPLSGIFTKQLRTRAHASKISAFGVKSCFPSISKNREFRNSKNVFGN